MNRFFALSVAKPETAQTGVTANRIALLVGNANYPEARLNNPTNDVDMLASVLRGIGFDTVVLKNASKMVLDQAIRDFGERVRRAATPSVAFLYYAGHGIQADGRNYLIPIDAGIPTTSHRRFKSKAVGLDFILGALRKDGTAAAVVVLDACRSGPFDGNAKVRHGLAPILSAPDGTLIAFSTAAGSTAEDGDGPCSPYAELLAQRLTEPGIELRLIFHRIADDLRVASGGAQSPFMMSQVFPAVILVDAVAPEDGERGVVPKPAAAAWRLGYALAVLGAGLTLPFAAATADLTPPWPDHVASLSTVVELLAAIFCYRSLKVAHLHRGNTRWKAGAAALTLIGFVYLALLSSFTYKDGGVREIKGFVCTQKAIVVHGDKCPNLTFEDIKDAEHNADQLWTTRSIDIIKLTLLTTWLLMSGILGVLIAGLFSVGMSEGNVTQRTPS